VTEICRDENQILGTGAKLVQFFGVLTLVGFLGFVFSAARGTVHAQSVPIGVAPVGTSWAMEKLEAGAFAATLGSFKLAEAALAPIVTETTVYMPQGEGKEPLTLPMNAWCVRRVYPFLEQLLEQQRAAEDAASKRIGIAVVASGATWVPKR
jgi:hypothetical protein